MAFQIKECCYNLLVWSSVPLVWRIHREITYVCIRFIDMSRIKILISYFVINIIFIYCQEVWINRTFNIEWILVQLYCLLNSLIWYNSQMNFIYLSFEILLITLHISEHTERLEQKYYAFYISKDYRGSYWGFAIRSVSFSSFLIYIHSVWLVKS